MELTLSGGRRVEGCTGLLQELFDTDLLVSLNILEETLSSNTIPSTNVLLVLFSAF